MPASDAAVSIQHPHLRQLHADLAAVTAEARRLRDDLTDDQLTWQPSPEAWSIANCFDHLYVAGSLYHPRLREAITRAPEAGADRAFKPSFFGRKFIQAVSPETKRRVKTFTIFKPEQAPTDAPALDRFIAQQDELAAILREADGHDLNSGKFSSPLNRLIRFTLGEGLTFIVAHQQRHLGQALRVMEAAGFPEG